MTSDPVTVRTTLKDVYFHALALAQLDRLARTLRKSRHQVVVLNLHRVSPHRSPYWPPLTPEAFESLAAHLARSCNVLTFAELAREPAGKRLRVVLSFDDGCKDFIEYAMPILSRYGLRANHNVIVQSVETGRPPWTIALMDALGAARFDDVRALRVPGFRHVLQDDSDRSKVRYGTLLANYLKAMSATARKQVLESVTELLATTDPDAWTQMMSMADVKDVATVHELGSHSYGHESMSELTDEEFETDVMRCQAFFATIGRSMKIFAFPNGSFRSGQVDWLLARGVEHVLLVEDRASTNIIGVHPRIPIYGDSTAELRVRAMGLAKPLKLTARRRGS